MFAPGEMCFEGMGAVAKGGLRCWHRVNCVLRAWGQLQRGGLRCWHRVKCVLRAWGQLQRGFEVGTCLKYVLTAWGLLKRGFEVLALGEMCFQGMGAIEKEV